MRRAVWALLIGVTAVGLLFLFVLPGQTWLQQSRDLRSTSASLHALNAENARLGHRIKALKNDQVIGNIAREQYGLVMPGQKAYDILPPPSNGSTSGTPSGTSKAPGGSGSSRLASGSTGRTPTKSAAGEPALGPSRTFWQRLEFWN